MFCGAWITFMLAYVNFMIACLCLKKKCKKKKSETKWHFPPVGDGGKGCLVAP